ncbi:MAG TPA: oligosaccharide flippase family protein [Pyrinomonadaceae bacterium]|nr:oligosaccharide flippase family protein [Pyrinomonadaceae bacterium]
MATVELDVTAAGEVREPAAVRESAERGEGRLTHKAYLNAFATLLDMAVKNLVTAFVTPLLVAGLGAPLFGVWQILAKLVTYMQAADGRPTQALKWVIANRREVDGDEEKRRYVGSAVGVWLLFLPVLALVGAALVWAAPHFAKTPPESHATVRLTTALLVLSFLLTQLVLLPEAVLRGMNLGYKRMGLQAALSVVGGCLSVGALYAGGGLVGLAAAQVALVALTGVLFLLVVKRFVPWFGVARASFKEVRQFLRLSVWYFAWTFVHRFILASDVVILGVVVSSSAVAAYTLTNFAGGLLLGLVTASIGAATPGLGGVVGRKEFEKAAALRAEMMTLSWLLLASAGSAVIAWNRSFVSLWVGAEHYAGFWPNLLAVLMTVQLIFIRNDSYVIDLTLQLREKVLTGAASAVLSVGLAVALTPRLGITGLCLGMLGGRAVLTFAYPLLVNSQLGLPRPPRLSGAVRPAATMALMFAASAWLGQAFTAGGWLVWLACAGVTFGAALLFSFFVGLPASARRALAKRLNLLRTLPAARARL